MVFFRGERRVVPSLFYRIFSCVFLAAESVAGSGRICLRDGRKSGQTNAASTKNLSNYSHVVWGSFFPLSPPPPLLLPPLRPVRVGLGAKWTLDCISQSGSSAVINGRRALAHVAAVFFTLPVPASASVAIFSLLAFCFFFFFLACAAIVCVCFFHRPLVNLAVCESIETIYLWGCYKSSSMECLKQSSPRYSFLIFQHSLIDLTMFY